MTDKPTLLSSRQICRVDFRAGETVTHAVKDVSFDIDQGETVALVGESGSGKTVYGACRSSSSFPTPLRRILRARSASRARTSWLCRRTGCAMCAATRSP